MTKKIIAIDLDNTILSTAESILSLWNKLNPNKQLTYREDIEWDFSNILNGQVELSELFKLFDHKDFYKDIIVYNNAIESINELSKDYKVIIVTKHMDSRKPLTTKWVKETFPNVKLIFTDTFDKSEVYNKAWLILDDRIDALESCTNMDTYRMCFGRYNWNSRDKWTGSRVLNWEHFTRRVKCLNRIEKYIEE